jgi:methyl-accepting chemotaxis protein
MVRTGIYLGVVRKGLSQHELFILQKNLALTFSYADEFNAKADTSVIASYSQVNKSNEAKYTNQILLPILTTNKLPDNIDPEEWWVTTGTLIDNIIKIQERLINITKENSQALLKAETEALYLTVALLVGILILVMFIILFTIKNITGILNNLQNAAEKMALGESAVQLNLNTNDALGSLERSIKSIDVNNNILAKAADSIGKGDFDIAITPRSKKDVLGNAIVQMKEELQRLSVESSEKIWVQSKHPTNPIFTYVQIYLFFAA